jgi:hypothetical protein
LNKNNTVLSIFTIVAVFAMGFAVYPHQNAAATIQDAQQAIRDAQNDLNGVTFPTASNETRASIAEGQEGLANVSSMLNNLNGNSGFSSPSQGASPLDSLGTDSLGQGASPLDSLGTDSLGQGASPSDQGTSSADNSPSQQ